MIVDWRESFRELLGETHFAEPDPAINGETVPRKFTHLQIQAIIDALGCIVDPMHQKYIQYELAVEKFDEPVWGDEDE